MQPTTESITGDCVYDMKIKSHNVYFHFQNLSRSVPCNKARMAYVHLGFLLVIVFLALVPNTYVLYTCGIQLFPPVLLSMWSCVLRAESLLDSTCCSCESSVLLETSGSLCVVYILSVSVFK